MRCEVVLSESDVGGVVDGVMRKDDVGRGEAGI